MALNKIQRQMLDDNVVNELDGLGTQLAETVKYVNVNAYGAVGDSTTNSTLSIRSAITECVNNKSNGINPVLYFPPSKGYVTTDKIYIPDGISVVMESPIIYDGLHDKTVIEIGSATMSRELTLKLNVISKTQSTWDNANYIGIQLINIANSNINIVSSKGFYIGAQLIAKGNGFAWNQVTLGYFRGNKYGLDLTNVNAGWQNANTFYGGSFASGVINGKSRYGIRITSQDGSYVCNSNIFYTPWFEISRGDASPNESIPVLIESGVNNKFINIRTEGNDLNTFARITNTRSENNQFSFLSAIDSSARIDASATDSPHSNKVIDNAEKYLVYDSGDMFKNLGYYETDKAHIPNVHFLDIYNHETISKRNLTSSSNVKINTDYLTLSTFAAVGVFIDTTQVKQFLVSPICGTDNNGFRLRVACYDSSGNIMNHSVTGRLVTQSNSSNFNWNTYFGGHYVMPANTRSSIEFTVSPSVAKIRVFVTDNIRQFKVYGIGNDKATYDIGYEEIQKGTNIGISIPVNGTWDKGSQIYNDNPQGNSYLGWVCVTGGTANNTAWAASTAYTVGQRVNANSKVYECTVAGTSGTSAPSHATGEAVDGTVTWKYINPLAVFKGFGMIQS